MSFLISKVSFFSKVAGVFFLAWALSLGEVTAQESKPVYKVYVDGLSCPFCTYGIEKKFNEVEGVQTIDIDLKTGATVITMKPGATLDEDTARKTVEAAGFTLRDFERVQKDEQKNPSSKK
ncbi:Heavy-metal-associated domain-containing protein [Nitrospina watsonii]|uniref:Heavy-metal-associated domain-containing protein n=2 Tax=Nitrospina watsonii TaxID=1323948 RepID=A0ABM9HHT0_9BACT|nr:Heavy-metal-associated domain-containing protein [Nitrospina watsonii]